MSPLLSDAIAEAKARRRVASCVMETDPGAIFDNGIEEEGRGGREAAATVRSTGVDSITGIVVGV